MENVKALNASVDVYNLLTFHELPRRPPLRIFLFQMSLICLGEEKVLELVDNIFYIFIGRDILLKRLTEGSKKNHV